MNPRSPETGRRTRDLISGFRKLVKQKGAGAPTRAWAAEWLLYLEGYTTEAPSATVPKIHLPSTSPETLEAIQAVEEILTPEEQKLRELLKEKDNADTE
jgi:hypothetical protein